MSDATDVRALVEAVLAERFPQAKIDEVVVRADEDSDGDKILRIAVVFDTHGKQLDREGLVGFVRHLRGRLAQARRDEFPVLSFISKQEAAGLDLASV